MPRRPTSANSDCSFSTLCRKLLFSIVSSETVASKRDRRNSKSFTESPNSGSCEPDGVDCRLPLVIGGVDLLTEDSLLLPIDLELAGSRGDALVAALADDKADDDRDGRLPVEAGADSCFLVAVDEFVLVALLYVAVSL